MPFALYLAMQAAGMITDYLGTSEQEKYTELGYKLQTAGIDANIYQTRLQSEELSLSNMQKLRQTLGSQIAVMAARGESTAQGSAVGMLNESVSNFNADERVRKLNQMGRENQLRAGKIGAMLQNNAEVNKLWQGFYSRTFNKFPTSPQGWSQLGSDAGKSFGMTSAGG